LPDIEPMRGVYRPSADSVLLLEALSRARLPRSSDVLDLGCGSGVLGIAVAAFGHRVDAVDREHCAVVSARRNAALNGVNVRVLEGDLFEPVRGRRYDAILANPPYIPTPPRFRGRRHSWSDGGADGRQLLDRICREVSQALQPEGSLWLVQSSLADISRSIDLLEESGLSADVVAERFEPFGPVTFERLNYLIERGFIGPDDTQERLVVLRATKSS